MHKDIGNSLIYLLSEKKELKYKAFQRFFEKLCLRKGFKLPDDFYSIVRDLSALGYLDIGKTSSGNTIIQINPPSLLALPFIRPTFLLTGARSQRLTEEVKNKFKKELTVKKSKLYPYGMILTPESIKTLEEKFRSIDYFGDPLYPHYMKVYKSPRKLGYIKLFRAYKKI